MESSGVRFLVERAFDIVEYKPIPFVKDYQSHVEVELNLLESLCSHVLCNRLQKSPVVDVTQSA